MRTLFLTTLLLSCLAPHTSAQPAEGILFLHLRLEGDRVSLVQQTRTAGTLKPQRADSARGGLELELHSERGELLWKHVVPDPGVRRIEYEDSERPGEMKVRELTLTNVEFTVRVPAHPEGRSVSVARRIGTDRKTKKATTQALGRVVLKQVAEQK